MATARAALRFADIDTVGLLGMVRAGDNEAFGELFVRYEGFARKVARRMSRRHADDLVSESFRRVFTAISRGAGPSQAFGPYLSATIRTAAAGLTAPYQEVELDVSELVSEETGDVDPRVSTAFVKLPEAWQNALWYSDVEGMSPRHAAPLLGLPTANAFSALRQRARTGLRSAYLTEVVDGACNESVREHLQLLIAGRTTPEVLDRLVDEHIEQCDECAAIAWRVATVSGSRVGLVLAPAMLAFHGFATTGSLLPTGLGLTGIWGWIWQLPSHAGAAATATVTVTAGAVATAAIVVAAATGGDGGSAMVPSTTAVTESGPVVVAADDSPSGGATAADTEALSAATGSTISTSPASSTTSTSIAPGVIVVSPPPPSVTAPITTTSTVPSGVITTTPAAATTSTIAPSTTAPPAATTTVPAATTTVPTATTTVPTATTTVPTTVPTVTTTTSVPTSSPGTSSITSDFVIGQGNGPKRRITIDVAGLTGAPGTVSFSTPVRIRSEANASCTSTICTLNGAVAPASATVEIEFDDGPITIELRDGAGDVVGIYS